MTKKVKILIVTVALILVAAILFFIFRKPKVIAEVNTEGTITPADSTITPNVNDNFPLNVGSNGPNVKRLQTALNRIKKTDPLLVDGNFGSKTRVKLLTTVKTTLSVLPMTEANLNEIIKMGNNA